MARFSSSTTASEPQFEGEVLGEERVRDQLGVAEELVFTGHREPALVAAGAAIEGAVRLAAGAIAGFGASVGALVEALLAYGALSHGEHEEICATIAARDRVVHGFAPDDPHATDGDRLGSALGIAIRLLEPSPFGHNPN